MAVAQGRDIAYYRYMEAGPSVRHGLGIFGHAAVELLHGGVLGEVYGVEVARSDAASAADAVVVVDRHLLPLRIEGESVVSAFAHASAASPAAAFVDHRLAVAVLVLLPGSRAAAHAYVLQRTSESGHLVPLEVRERDEYVGVHYRASDFRLLYIFASLDGNGDVVGALEPVRYYHWTAGAERGEAVLPGTVEMLQGVLAAPRIQRVAVGEEGLAAEFAHDFDDGPRVVRPQERHVALLAEVHLDRDELAIHVYPADSCGLYQCL